MLEGLALVAWKLQLGQGQGIKADEGLADGRALRCRDLVEEGRENTVVAQEQLGTVLRANANGLEAGQEEA